MYSTEDSLEHQPLTYALILFAEIVRSAVSKSIREQQNIITGNSNIVIYDFREEGRE